MNSLKSSLTALAVFFLCHDVKMSCGKCAEKIEGGMKKLSFVSDARVSLRKGSVRLSSEKEFTLSQKTEVAKIYKDLGYEAKEVPCNSSL